MKKKPEGSATLEKVTEPEALMKNFNQVVLNSNSTKISYMKDFTLILREIIES